MIVIKKTGAVSLILLVCITGLLLMQMVLSACKVEDKQYYSLNYVKLNGWYGKDGTFTESPYWYSTKKKRCITGDALKITTTLSSVNVPGVIFFDKNDSPIECAMVLGVDGRKVIYEERLIAPEGACFYTVSGLNKNVYSDSGSIQDVIIYQECNSILELFVRNSNFDGYMILFWVILSSILLIKCKWRTQIRIGDTLFCICFSLISVCANSYELTDTSEMVLGSKHQLFLAFTMFLLLWILSVNSVSIIRMMVYWLDHYMFKIPRIWECHSFLFPFSIIFLLWLPHAVVRFPAGIEWDAYHQIMQFCGDAEINQHWPIASTFFLGGTFKLGIWLFGNNNVAGLFVVIVQMFVCDACLSYSTLVQKRLGVSNGWRILTLIGYSFFTIYPRYLTALVKDAMFACFVVLFVSQLAQILFIESKKKYLLLFFSGFGVAVLRNNGKYILLAVLLSSLVYIFKESFASKEYERIRDGFNVSGVIKMRPNKYCIVGMVMLMCLLCCSAWVNFFDILGIAKGSIRDALSIPFQQTARYVSKYDVTANELEAIDKVLDYDEIQKGYNPKLSDNVKKAYRDSSRNDLADYFIFAWIPEMVKHPFVYIEATFNNIEGFLWPGAKENGDIT